MNFVIGTYLSCESFTADIKIVVIVRGESLIPIQSYVGTKLLGPMLGQLNIVMDKNKKV